MSTFVLVHPAWFGGWCWKKLTPLLRAHGHAVHTPTLTGLGERRHLARPDVGLATHVDDVVGMIECEDLHSVILVGNSSGGMVITGVADRVPDRISHIVYLDAFVPEDGESLRDLIPPERRSAMEALVQGEGDGWLLPRLAPPPWETFVPEAWGITEEADLSWVLPRLAPTPFGHFTEPVQRRNADADKLPRTYIRCLGWPSPYFDRFAAAARDNKRWRCFEMPTPHLPYITHPRQTSELLLLIAS